MSKKIPGTDKRTIVVHIASYNEILEFFAASPAGITGAAAIRELIRAFGDYCKEQRRKNQIASGKDLEAARGIVLEKMGEQKNV